MRIELDGFLIDRIRVVKGSFPDHRYADDP